ncbi:MAG TPA: hypothetical protein VFJ91_05355 [Gaiellaceae bacterium]|nr:hypothetical protein [Gaiellaceae bacterium]
MNVPTGFQAKRAAATTTSPIRATFWRPVRTRYADSSGERLYSSAVAICVYREA